MNLFLSVPFSNCVDASGNVVADYRRHLEDLLSGLRAKGHTVFCAPEFAEWKMGGILLPEEELKHDLEQINASDRVIVLLEEPVSAGVQLENGYAFAKGKTVDTYQIGKPAWSNLAFSRLNGHEITPVQSIDDFTAQVLIRY